MVQTATPELQARLAGPQRQPGVEVRVDGWPYVLAYGRAWTLPGSSTPTTRAVVFGDDASWCVFGGTNPTSGSALVFGDTITTVDYPDSIVLHNILNISSFEVRVAPNKRVPNFPNMELTLSNADVLSAADDPTGREVIVRYNIGTSYTNSIILFAGTVKSFDCDEEGVTYRMVLQHWAHLLNKDIFGNPSDELAVAMTDSDTTCTLSDASLFPNVGTIMIGSEIMPYTSKAGNVLSGITRPTYTKAAHTVEAPVTYCQHWRGDGVRLQDALLQILTSTGAGTNGSHDVLVAESGCAIPTDWIDTTTFTAYDSPDSNDNAALFDLIYVEKKKAAEAIEPFLAALNAYLVIGNNGMLRLEPDAVPAAGDLTVSYSNILARPKRMRGDAINRIEWLSKARYDNAKGLYTTKIIEDTPSIAAHGEKLYKWDLPVYTSWSIAGGGHGKIPPDEPPNINDFDARYYHIINAAQWLLQKYREPHDVYSFRVHWSALLYEQADALTYVCEDATSVYPYINGRSVDPKSWTIELSGIVKNT